MAQSWVDRVSPYKVGDVVRFSGEWLRNTGQFAGDICHAEGKILEINRTPDYTIATIEWNTPDLPSKVNTRNLERLSRGRGR